MADVDAFEAAMADLTAHLQQQMAANRAPPQMPAPQMMGPPPNRLLAPFTNPATGEQVSPDDMISREVPSQYSPENILGSLVEGLPSAMGMSGGPAGLVGNTVRHLANAPSALGSIVYGAGKGLAAARELPGQMAGVVGDVVDTVGKAFKAGNVTEADRAADAAAKAKSASDFRRQTLDVIQRERQRVQDRQDWVSDYVRGQPLPQGLARHEYEAMLQDFDRLAFQNRGDGGRWLSQDATRAEIEAARDAAPRERRSLAPRERREAPASANQSPMNRLLQDAPQSSRPSTGAIITGAGAAGALGTAGYLKAVQSGLLPRPEWMNRLQPGRNDLGEGK